MHLVNSHFLSKMFSKLIMNSQFSGVFFLVLESSMSSTDCPLKNRLSTTHLSIRFIKPLLGGLLAIRSGPLSWSAWYLFWPSSNCNCVLFEFLTSLPFFSTPAPRCLALTTKEIVAFEMLEPPCGLELYFWPHGAHDDLLHPCCLNFCAYQIRPEESNNLLTKTHQLYVKQPFSKNWSFFGEAS